MLQRAGCRCVCVRSGQSKVTYWTWTSPCIPGKSGNWGKYVLVANKLFQEKKLGLWIMHRGWGWGGVGSCAFECTLPGTPSRRGQITCTVICPNLSGQVFIIHPGRIQLHEGTADDNQWSLSTASEPSPQPGSSPPIPTPTLPIHLKHFMPYCLEQSGVWAFHLEILW